MHIVGPPSSIPGVNRDMHPLNFFRKFYFAQLFLEVFFDTNGTLYSVPTQKGVLSFQCILIFQKRKSLDPLVSLLWVHTDMRPIRFF